VASSSVPVTVIRSSNSLDPRCFLVPYDFTPRSDAALDYAHARAKKNNASLHILNSVPAATVPVVSQQLLVMRDDVTASRKKRLADRIEGFDVPVETEFSYEPPHTAIVEASHRLLESEIVMATHARGKFGRIALGSVAERVLREVDRPVTLVPFHE
jgi:nucleotide-binding universal stress UspA family protein